MDELRTAMSDGEIIGHCRRTYPCISQAKATHQTWLKFRHLGAGAEREKQDAADVERRRLRDRLFTGDGGSDAGEKQ